MNVSPHLQKDAGTTGTAGTPGTAGGVAGTTGLGGIGGATTGVAGAAAGSPGIAGEPGVAGSPGAGGSGAGGSAGVAGSAGGAGVAGSTAAAGTTGVAGSAVAGATGSAGSFQDGGATGIAGSSGGANGGVAGGAVSEGGAGTGGGLAGAAGVAGGMGRGGAAGGASCTPENCADGCCNGTTCVHKPTTQMCGKGGAACATCGGCQTCNAGECRIDPASRWILVCDSAQAMMTPATGGQWDPQMGQVGGPAPDLFCQFEHPGQTVSDQNAGVTTTIMDKFVVTWNQIITPANRTVAASELMAKSPTWRIWVGDEDCSSSRYCGDIGQTVCAYRTPFDEATLKAGTLMLTNVDRCMSLTVKAICQP